MNTQELVANCKEQFNNAFGENPQKVVLSPGRINIIGEHIDYNHGFVLPAAIDKYICFAISKNNTQDCHIISIDLKDEYKFNIKDKIEPVEQNWVNYFLGVFNQVQDKIDSGFNIVFSSTVPIGAGLSSSAALECGFLYGLNYFFALGLDKRQIAKMGQKAEHTFAGVNCGIMDQFASVFGKENSVIFLDCDTLDYQYAPADFGDYTLLLLNTNVKHNLQTSEYNNRRKECEAGISIIKNKYPEVQNFREATMEMVEDLKDEMGDVVYRRSRFVVGEISRIQELVKSLKDNNFENVGKLMTSTHYGLSKDYEVSCEELDFLVDNVLLEEGVLGARVMGGGFGGCTINLLKKSEVEKIIEKLSKAYLEKFEIELTPYQVSISEGTHFTD